MSIWNAVRSKLETRNKTAIIIFSSNLDDSVGKMHLWLNLMVFSAFYDKNLEIVSKNIIFLRAIFVRYNLHLPGLPTVRRFDTGTRYKRLLFFMPQHSHLS